MDDIRQLKLSTGEEVVCEILDWADEQEGDIVVRNMYLIHSKDDDMRGYRYYHLKPWMTMQEGDDKFITVNTIHIVSQAKPDQNLIDQWERAIENSKLTEEEIAEKIEKYLKKVKVKIDERENVINFPSIDRDKLH